ncbi:MAG: hypothetical protein J5621_08190 [Paludibacteraceae bacterium]|nr:hypothetical protein [Paludibacteraceae bacterium]
MKTFRSLCRIVSGAALLASVILLEQGCKSVSPTVTTPRNDSIIIRTHYERDSIFIHDSMAVAMVQDTIYIDRWHTKYRYSVLNKTDTIYQDKEIVIHSPPEKCIPSFYRWCTRVFIISIILLICYIILRVIIKIYLKR